MNIRGIRTWLGAALAVALVLTGWTPQARAYDPIDIGRQTSLTVSFARAGDGIAGAQFSIYRVAAVSKTGQFTLTGDFAGYPVSLSGLSSSGWRALAQTLEGYVARDGVPPLQTETTGSGGRAAFEGLPTGLYLVTGARHTVGRTTYTPEPFLLCLPNWDGAAWQYAVEVSCKYDRETRPSGDGGGSTVSRRVIKVWQDGMDWAARPAQIEVQLLQDGEVYDTATLSDGNNWRYTWSGLPSGHTWQLTETSVPDGYTVSVEREGSVFVLTNRDEEEIEIDDEPVPGDDMPPLPDAEIDDEPVPESDFPDGDPDDPNEETVILTDDPVPRAARDSEETAQSQSAARLPQTGMLWWPVPVLACGGMVLFLIGWSRGRHE